MFLTTSFIESAKWLQPIASHSDTPDTFLASHRVATGCTCRLQWPKQTDWITYFIKQKRAECGEDWGWVQGYKYQRLSYLTWPTSLCSWSPNKWRRNINRRLNNLLKVLSRCVVGYQNHHLPAATVSYWSIIILIILPKYGLTHSIFIFHVCMFD